MLAIATDFFDFNIGNVITWVSVFVTSGVLLFLVNRKIDSVDTKSDRRFQQNKAALEALAKSKKTKP